VGVVCLALAATVVLYRYDPATAVLFPPCPFRALTGYLCPGCGSARAMHAMLHGELSRAFALNPLTTLGMPLLAVGSLQELRRCWRGGPPAGHRLPAWLIRGIAVVLVAFAVVRNLA